MGWVKCCECNEQIGMTDEVEAVLRRSGRTFHCVWGHPQHFQPGKTEAKKLQEQLYYERRLRQQAEQRVAYQAEKAATAKRSAAAFKGQVTRLKGRAKAGLCPCCNRSFSQLARHMASKHPNFSPEAQEEENGQCN